MRRLTVNEKDAVRIMNTKIPTTQVRKNAPFSRVLPLIALVIGAVSTLQGCSESKQTPLHVPADAVEECGNLSKFIQKEYELYNELVGRDNKNPSTEDPTKKAKDTK